MAPDTHEPGRHPETGADRSATTAAPTSTDTDVDTGPVRVLFVDDDSAMRRLTKTLLERTDDRIAVVTATDAETGLARLDDTDVDCVVSDYHLPGTDGFAFLTAVRERLSDLPFILFTGVRSESVATEAISAGVTDHVRKAGPEQYELLANRITNSVARHRAERRVRDHERVRTVVRLVRQALVRAPSREVLEAEVCETLGHAAGYLFAWIGEIDADTGAVVARTAAERDVDYLAVPLGTNGDAPGQTPTSRAVSTGSVQVVQNVVVDDTDDTTPTADIESPADTEPPADTTAEPWRERAAARGIRAVAAIPLVHQDVSYGVLTVYAGEPDAFDESERRLLAAVGDDVAHALHSLDVQARLRESEARFRQLAENLTDVVWMVDESSGGTAYVNTAYEAVSGRPIESASERPHPFTTAVHPADRERVLAAVERRAAAGYDETYRILRPDGTVRWIHERGVPIRDESGAVFRVVGIASDVTEQRERERELRAFEEALEHAGNSIYLTGTDGTIEYVNPAFERETGYSSDELVGSSPSILNSGEQDDEFYAALWETILEGDVWSGELLNRRKDGTQYVVRETIAPITNATGAVERFVAVNVDVTQEREHEAALEESERQFGAVFEGAFDAMLIANDDAEYVDANPAACELFGVPRAELLGCTPADFAAPDYDVEAAWAAFQQSDRDRGLFPLQRPDGTQILVEFAATPNVLPGRHLSVLRDVTALQHYRQRLEQHRDKLQVLNRVLRHDIRNDANVILGYAELLEEGTVETTEATDAIVRRTGDLVRVAEQARAIEATTGDRLPRVRVDLGATLRAVADRFGDEHPNAEIRVEGPDSAPGWVLELVDSVFVNLVENALEHTDRTEPVVVLRLRDHPDRGRVTVEIEDDGPGLPESVLELIERGTETPLRHTDGLGLWLVRWVVAASGGTLEFERADPRGTLVRLSFLRDMGPGGIGDGAGGIPDAGEE